jgi:membrane-bound serine protease (ClpP class)
MAKICGFVLAYFFLLSIPPGFGRIARISLDGAIDPVTAGFVARCIDQAEQDKAQFLLIRLQTPGGFGSSMEEIIGRMLSSNVPTVV